MTLLVVTDDSSFISCTDPLCMIFKRILQFSKCLLVSHFQLKIKGTKARFITISNNNKILNDSGFDSIKNLKTFN